MRTLAAVLATLTLLAAAPARAFNGGGGLFVLPGAYWVGSRAPRVGMMIGGGGIVSVWRDHLRIGGYGAEGWFGSTDDWELRLNLGGLIVEGVLHPRSWMEAHFGVKLGFGSGKLETRVARPEEQPGHTTVDRVSSFIFLPTPYVGLGFIPTKFVRVSLVAEFVYGQWSPDIGFGVVGGLWLAFGNFSRP